MGQSFNIGDIVKCSPEGEALPRGLPKDTPVRVVATYIGAIYVLHNGRTFALSDKCVVHHATENKKAPA